MTTPTWITEKQAAYDQANLATASLADRMIAEVKAEKQADPMVAQLRAVSRKSGRSFRSGYLDWVGR